jgi:nucleoside-diphosphate-sugar epimerase
MRIFVTGATGFVGSAVVRELLGAGHQVLGLARSDASAAALTAVGADVHRGSIDELDGLERGAAASDGVVHTAFDHDFSKYVENCERDRRAIAALGAGLAGTDRRLVVTSGIGLLPRGALATETTPPAPSPRAASEEAATELASRGVRVSIVRLPPSVHGDGDHGFVPMLIGIARSKGASAYVGDGGNHWPAVHQFDAARLYRLVLEQGATGAAYHAVDEQGVPFRDIAGAIGRGLNVDVRSVDVDHAADHFGWFTTFASIDVQASSEITRERLGWAPREKGLIADLDTGRYFAT